MEQQLNSNTGGWIGDDRSDEADFTFVSQTIAKPHVSRWLSVEELRTGNCLYYVDTDQVGKMISRIDWQDLQWLTKKPESFNECHKPIVLTVDVLDKCAISINRVSVSYRIDLPFKNEVLFLSLTEVGNGKPFTISIFSFGTSKELRQVNYLHDLQNLYWSLTGTDFCTKGLVAAIG
jgi:hypothetical protein